MRRQQRFPVTQFRPLRVLVERLRGAVERVGVNQAAPAPLAMNTSRNRVKRRIPICFSFGAQLNFPESQVVLQKSSSA